MGRIEALTSALTSLRLVKIKGVSIADEGGGHDETVRTRLGAAPDAPIGTTRHEVFACIQGKDRAAELWQEKSSHDPAYQDFLVAQAGGQELGQGLVRQNTRRARRNSVTAYTVDLSGPSFAAPSFAARTSATGMAALLTAQQDEVDEPVSAGLAGRPASLLGPLTATQRARSSSIDLSRLSLSTHSAAQLGGDSRPCTPRVVSGSTVPSPLSGSASGSTVCTPSAPSGAAPPWGPSVAASGSAGSGSAQRSLQAGAPPSAAAPRVAQLVTSCLRQGSYNSGPASPASAAGPTILRLPSLSQSGAPSAPPSRSATQVGLVPMPPSDLPPSSSRPGSACLVLLDRPAGAPLVTGLVAAQQQQLQLQLQLQLQQGPGGPSGSRPGSLGQVVPGALSGASGWSLGAGSGGGSRVASGNRARHGSTCSTSRRGSMLVLPLHGEGPGEGGGGAEPELEGAGPAPGQEDQGRWFDGGDLSYIQGPEDTVVEQLSPRAPSSGPIARSSTLGMRNLLTQPPPGLTAAVLGGRRASGLLAAHLGAGVEGEASDASCCTLPRLSSTGMRAASTGIPASARGLQSRGASQLLVQAAGRRASTCWPAGQGTGGPTGPSAAGEE